MGGYINEKITVYKQYNDNKISVTVKWIFYTSTINLQIMT